MLAWDGDERTATLFDYLPAGSPTLALGDVEDAARRFLDDAGQRWTVAGDGSGLTDRLAELIGRGFRVVVAAEGHAALSLARDGVLAKYGVEMIGASRDAIDKAEDRERFRHAMTKIGLATPRGQRRYEVILFRHISMS